MKKKQLGKLGERLARKHLRSRGYSILEKNFSCRFGEIDVVCLEGGDLVFVEVKTRWGESFGRPEEAVTERKINQVKKIGLYYKTQHSDLPESLRIDAVAVSLSPGGKLEKIKVFKNITR